MNFFYRLFICFCLFSGIAKGDEANIAEPFVVTSMPVIELLTKELLKDTDIPVVSLLKANADLHHHALKVSDIRLVREASVLVWYGPKLEAFLDGVEKDPYKQFVIYDVITQSARKGVEGEGSQHFWLDPVIVENTVPPLSVKLQSRFPAASEKIKANAKSMVASIQTAHAKILQNWQKKSKDTALNFVIYHDAINRYVMRYGLTQLGELTDENDHRHGLKNLTELLKISENASCLLATKNEKLAAEKMAKKLKLNTVSFDLQPLKNHNSYAEFILTFNQQIHHCF